MPRPSSGKPCKNPVGWELASNFLGKIVSVDFYIANRQPIQAYVVTENINQVRSSTWNYLYWTTGQFAGTSAYMYYAPTCNESNHVFAVSGVDAWQAKRVDSLPDNCGGCVFKITKNGQVVYQKTDAVCPTVTYTCGEQCPAGSCECACGKEVCCHHPTTGKVIKSFTR
jgi:hypothetical protein